MANITKFSIMMVEIQSRAVYWLDVTLNTPLSVPAITNTAPHPLTSTELGNNLSGNGGLQGAMFPNRVPGTRRDMGPFGVANLLLRLSKLSGVSGHLQSGLTTLSNVAGTAFCDDEQDFQANDNWDGTVFYRTPFFSAGIKLSTIATPGSADEPQRPFWVNGNSYVHYGAGNYGIPEPNAPAYLQTFLGHLNEQSYNAVQQVLSASGLNQQEVQAALNGSGLTPTADLQITSSVSPSMVAVGRSNTFSATVTNNGPSTASNVMVNLIIASGVSGTSSFSLGNLNSGASSNISTTLTYTQAGNKVITANVTSSTTDTNPGNNSSSNTVSVCSISISNLRGGPACVDSFFDVFFDIAVQNGSDKFTGKATFNGSDYPFEYRYDALERKVRIMAPSVVSDYPLTLKVQDKGTPSCSDSKSITIQVRDVAVNAGLDREIVYGQSTQLGVGPAAPNVAYLWSPGGMTTLTPTVAPLVDTTYTVEAHRTDTSDCMASDSVTVMVCRMQLSDIKFTGLGQTAFTVSGTQFGSKPGTRFVDITYQNQTHHYTFTNDGPFSDSFQNITVGGNVTIHAYYSDNLACSDIVTFASQVQDNQGVISFKLVGSLLAFDLALTPEATLALLPPTSDIHVVLQRLCDFAATQPCERTVANLTVTQQSDVFSDNSLIMQGSHTVFVSCSDDTIYLNDVDGDFLFNIHPFLSDNVVVTYNDQSSSVVSNMTFASSGFNIAFNNQSFVWLDPCFSDYPHVAVKDFVDCAFLCADISSSVTGLDMADCIPLCHDHTSDLSYVCHLLACEAQTESYLAAHFSGYIFSDKCCISYSGSITADNVHVDLNTCLLLFSSIHLPPCSDIAPC